VRIFAGEVERDAEMTSFRIKGGQKYHGADIEIEGDWSSAAFLLAAGALCGEVTVEGLRPISRQADKAILNALTAARAGVAWSKTGLKVTKGQLKAFQFDATQCPDLIPPLAALACGCDGKTMIKGAERLKHRENERASALWSELTKIGARVELRGDWIIVQGHKPSGGTVDSHGDHRVAMACAVAGLISESGVSIDGDACVAKSYPNFFADLESIRVQK
jgi:3-phosphoshikimate 1-carboxyvinyltransferase